MHTDMDDLIQTGKENPLEVEGVLNALTVNDWFLNVQGR
jgi:hypothetical protein